MPHRPEFITGPFPALEESLVQTLQEAARGAGLGRVAIIVPSRHLVRRLERLFAVERRITLLGVPILTFGGLAAAVWRLDGRGNERLFRSDFVAQERLRVLLRASASPVLRGLADRSGGPAAVRASLRDLEEANLAPEEIRHAAEEGHLDARESRILEGLLQLRDDLQSWRAGRGLVDRVDLVRRATDAVAAGRVELPWSRLLYYGFYELTPIQEAFFTAVSETVPAVAFLPLDDGDSGWKYAEQFFNLHFARFPHRKAAPVAAEPVTPEIWSVSGAGDEVRLVAKQIREELDRNPDPTRLAVVARSLDPYWDSLRAVFREHAIPVATPSMEPAHWDPAVFAWGALLRVLASDFGQDEVLGLLSLEAAAAPERVERDRIRLDIRDRDLAGGMAWDRFLTQAEAVARDEEQSKDPLRRARAPRTRALAAWARPRRTRPPESASPSVHAAWLRDAARLWLTNLPDTGPGAKDAPFLADFELLDDAGPLSRDEFLETVGRLLAGLSRPAGDPRVRGVAVLDAMAARGGAWDHVYVLGLQERSFPREAREDPLLPDPLRIMLRALGVPLNPKRDILLEESLLFTLLRGAARRRLFLTYQRTDQDGRAGTRSGLLDPLVAGNEIRTLPRDPESQFRSAAIGGRGLWTPCEALAEAAWRTGSLEPLWSACGGPAGVGSARGRWIDEVELGRSPGAFDGLLGPGVLDPARQSLSPTGLETLAECPFRYFGERILRLPNTEDPEGQEVPNSLAVGTLCHAVLEAFFSRPGCLDLGDAALDAFIREVFAREADAFARREPVGPELLWLHWRSVLEALLPQVARAERDRLKSEGWVPVATEASAAAVLDLGTSASPLPARVHGTIDRVDRPASGAPGIRVVDYKFTTKEDLSSLHWAVSAKDPLGQARGRALAEKGEKLQLPLYLRMAVSIEGLRPDPSDIGQLVFFGPRLPSPPAVHRRGLGRAVWDGGDSAPLHRLLAGLVRTVAEGIFPIRPAEHCRFCALKLVCRKNHPPSLARAEAIVEARGLGRTGGEPGAETLPSAAQPPADRPKPKGRGKGGRR